MDSINPPLSIFVLWHNKFDEGVNLSREIYKQFARDVKDPLNRGIGIPVYFFTTHADIFDTLQVSNSAKNIFIVFVEDNMVIDTEWIECIERISNFSDKNEGSILIPVGITKNAFNLSDKVARKNYIRLYDLDSYKKKESRLIFCIAHELCRNLYGIRRISEANSYLNSPSPVKLFISHAKTDGLAIAENINSFIQNDTPLDTFFDSNSITVGYDFENEIKRDIDGSVLLVVHSDKYSTREWCRKEILIAKRYNRPIVILNILEEGEDRGFPYMSNVRTIRISDDMNFEKIITKTLIETLKFKYQSWYISYLIKAFGMDINNKIILSNPPELLSLAHIEPNYKGDIIYPDPPLSDEEITLLTKVSGNLKFITPALFPLISLRSRMQIDDKIFMDYGVGISISENKDIKKYGFDYVHLQDFMNEVARYLLVIGCELVYGGDIHYKHEYNFVQSLFELAATHNKEHKDIPQKIRNFVAYPIYEKIEVSEKAELIKVATFNEVKPINNIKENMDKNEKIINALNLLKMRVEMNEYIKARIVIGGKTHGFTGRYPGILEEVYLAMQSKKPLFIIGAFGGVSRILAKVLTNKISREEFAGSFQLDSKFVCEYNEFVKKNNYEYEEIDFMKVYNCIVKFGIEGLNNGLSKEENERLFITNNLIEVITLIINGLCRLKEKELN